MNPGPKRTAATERYERSPEGLWLEIGQATATTTPAGITRNIGQVRNGTIQAVVHAVRPESFLVFGDSLLYPGSVDEGILRIRWTRESILIGAGLAQTVDRPRGTTVYSFVNYPVRTEMAYPKGADDPCVVSIRFRAADRKASIPIGGGPEVVLETAAILGLSYVGLSVSRGGALRIQKILVHSNP